MPATARGGRAIAGEPGVYRKQGIDWSQRMRESKVQVAIFYCQHRAVAMQQLLTNLGSWGGLNVRQVALPCSGKVEVLHLTKALESGADGVGIFGCPEKECHYVVGSERAKGRVGHTERILQEIGLEGDRVHRFVFPPQPNPGDFNEFSAWLEKVRAMKSIHSAGA